MEAINIGIFILDDDKDLLELVKREVDNAGIKNCKLFNDEDEFIAGLNRDLHVCVLDDKLARGKGSDMLLLIKKKNPGSYAIGYTANKDGDMLISYIKGKVDDWVVKKDGGFEELIEAIKAGVEIAKARVDLYNYVNNKKSIGNEQRMD